LTHLRAALVLLLVGSGLLFAIGSTVERHQHHAERPAVTSHSGESGNSGEAGGENGTGEGTTHSEQRHGESGVKLLGVNTESLALTIVAVAASFVLALAVWLGSWPRVTMLAVAAFGLVFAAGDARELVRQLDESNVGLATIAAILIAVHLAVTALAAALFPRRSTAGGAAVPEPYV
jgi:hypothetical protein